MNDFGGRRSSTAKHGDSVDDRERRTSIIEQHDSVDDGEQQHTALDRDDQTHSDDESSQSSVDERVGSESDSKVDRTVLGQIYVDPMIAKLKITDVILLFPFPSLNSVSLLSIP